jgi:hypothetical protein
MFCQPGNAKHKILTYPFINAHEVPFWHLIPWIELPMGEPCGIEIQNKGMLALNCFEYFFKSKDNVVDGSGPRPIPQSPARQRPSCRPPTPASTRWTSGAALWGFTGSPANRCLWYCLPLLVHPTQCFFLDSLTRNLPSQQSWSRIVARIVVPNCDRQGFTHFFNRHNYPSADSPLHCCHWALVHKGQTWGT